MDVPKVWGLESDPPLVICRLAGYQEHCKICGCSEVHEHHDRPTAFDPLGQRLCPQYNCKKRGCGRAACEPIETGTLTDEEKENWNLC